MSLGTLAYALSDWDAFYAQKMAEQQAALDLFSHPDRWWAAATDPIVSDWENSPGHVIGMTAGTVGTFAIPGGAALKGLRGTKALEEAARASKEALAATGALRGAVQVADRNGLTQAGRALQKHSDREGSVFYGLSTGGPAARNAQGLSVLDEILGDPNRRTEVLNRVTNIWDSNGRGVRFGNDGSFMGFLEPQG